MNSRYFTQPLIIFIDSNIVLVLINDKGNWKAGEQLLDLEVEAINIFKRYSGKRKESNKITSAFI